METYNGWTNYATWRVNLELFDKDWSEVEAYEDITALCDDLKEQAEQVVTNYGELDNLASASFAVDYALAFISDVNWAEIARHVVEDYPHIIKK